MKRSVIASTMNQVILNLSGKRPAHSTAVNMLAVAELYSWEQKTNNLTSSNVTDRGCRFRTFTTLSSFLRIAATTRPPTLLKRRPRARKSCVVAEAAVSWWRMEAGRSAVGEDTRCTMRATITPYRYSQNCCSRKFSPEFCRTE